MSKAPRFNDLTVQTPVQEAARTILRGYADAVLREAPNVLRGDDVRAVHDMRVALRRLRTLLALLRGCFSRRRLGRVQHQLRRLARLLGRIRDADVQLAALRVALGGATLEESGGITHAIETLGRRRRRALARFAIALSQFDRERLHALIEVAQGETPLADFVPKKISRRLRRFLRLLEQGLADESDEALHAARIGGKRLRYALEPFAALWGASLAAALKSLSLVQNRLGVVADVATFVTLYDELLSALEPADPRIGGLQAQIGASELQRERALADVRTLWATPPSYPAALTGLISGALSSASGSG